MMDLTPPSTEGITEMTSTDTATEAIEQRRVIRVHESRLAEAQALVAKVNKRAARYNLSEYVLDVSEPIVEPVFDPEMVKAFGAAGLDPIGYETFFDIQLTGEMPRLGNKSFVATLDYSEGVVITRPVPGVEVDLSAHRVREDECDHCHTKRNRNATYVLLDNGTGETMQVGSTCIQPYMGLNVNGLAWLAGDPFSEMSDMDERDESSGGWGGRAPSAFDVDSVMLYTMAIEQIEGWVSRATAEAYGRTATSQLIMTMLGVYKLTEREQEWKRRVIAIADWDAAKEKAELVKAWAVSQNGTSEWAMNLRSLAGLERVGFRNVALLASAVAGYNREVGIRIEREQRTPSEWVGTPGAKGKDAFIPVNGTVAFKFTSENEWGISTTYVIRGEGVTYKLRMQGVPFQEGDVLTGKAKVKAHETYRDEKQTVCWYPKLEKVAQTA